MRLRHKAILKRLESGERVQTPFEEWSQLQNSISNVKRAMAFDVTVVEGVAHIIRRNWS